MGNKHSKTKGWMNNDPFSINQRGMPVRAYLRHNIATDETLNHMKIPDAVQKLCMEYFSSFDGDLLIETKNRNDEYILESRSHGAYYEYDSITIKQGKLTVPAWNKKQERNGYLHIVCYGDIILQGSDDWGCSAQINLSGKGYPGANTKREKPVRFKGDLDKEMSILTLGSGGGVTFGNGAVYGSGCEDDDRVNPGGAGGGCLKIECFGTIKMGKRARIVCNGIETGQGGSIHIVVDSPKNIQFEKESEISARGGRYDEGRIRVQFRSNDWKSEIDYENQYNYGHVRPRPYYG